MSSRLRLTRKIEKIYFKILLFSNHLLFITLHALGKTIVLAIPSALKNLMPMVSDIERHVSFPCINYDFMNELARNFNYDISHI